MCPLQKMDFASRKEEKVKKLKKKNWRASLDVLIRATSKAEFASHPSSHHPLLSFFAVASMALPLFTSLSSSYSARFLPFRFVS